MSNPAIQIAETIQTASINRHPSARHDINPSTSASRKEPLTYIPASSNSTNRNPKNNNNNNNDDDDNDHGRLRPSPRKNTLPPLPDLRFEQSYLASISRAETRGAVVWITVRDQVFLPLLQGTIWTLILHGWGYWNRTASFNGKTIGLDDEIARIRRWWYGVNNWKIPPPLHSPAEKLAMNPKGEELAAEVENFYTAQFSSTGSD